MQETPVVEAQPEVRKPDLYSRHIEGFVKLAATEFNESLNQFGFTVWHSLPAKDAAAAKERLGIRPLDAGDYYNRGTALAMEGNCEKAVADLRAALKADPDFALAAYNLALCLEKLDRLADAREAWRNYLKLLERVRDRAKLGLATDAEIAPEAARVQQHLDSLGKA